MDNVKNLLEKEIKSEFEKLSGFESGSEDKASVIDDIATLYRLKIEEEKNEAEIAERQTRRIIEMRTNKLERDRLSESIKDRYFKLGIATAEIVLPLAFYGIWMRRGLKFEETGTFTSKTFTGLLNKFRPTKK